MLGDLVPELYKLGHFLCGYEIEYRMFQPCCGCCEILVQWLIVEGAYISIIGMGSLDIDLILFNLGIGGLPGDYLTAAIDNF